MKLQDAQMTKALGDDWSIITPDREVLTVLPPSLTDRQMIGILEFAQSHEKAAFHEGAEVGRATMEKVTSDKILAMQNHVQNLEEHNAKLALKLDELLTNGIN